MAPFFRTLVRAAQVAAPALMLTLAALPAQAQRGPTQRVMFRSDVPQFQHRLAATPAQVKTALLETYQQLGIPLSVSADDQWDLFTPHMRVTGKMYEHRPSEFFLCVDTGVGGNLADMGELTFAMLNQIVPGRDGLTTLRMQIDANVRRRDVSSDRMACDSKGEFEKALIALVDQRIAALQPAPVITDTAATLAPAPAPQP